MRLFSYRTIRLKGFSNCISDAIKACNNGGLGLKSVYFWVFYEFPYF